MNTNRQNGLSRREMLRLSALCAAGAAFSGTGALSVLADEKPFVYKVGIWSSDFDRAAALGLDCIQISFPLRPNGGANDMRLPEVREKMLAKSKETGIEITSLAMGEFNGNPFWEIDDAVEQVSSCIDAMAAMNVKNVLIS